MHKDLGCVVYWLHDRNCECPWRHGYIGISARWEVDRSGANNSRFGKPVSEATKEKMRQRIAERGGVDGPNNPNFKHGRYC
jgi:hypothetical protein